MGLWGFSVHTHQAADGDRNDTKPHRKLKWQGQSHRFHREVFQVDHRSSRFSKILWYYSKGTTRTTARTGFRWLHGWGRGFPLIAAEVKRVRGSNVTAEGGRVLCVLRQSAPLWVHQGTDPLWVWQPGFTLVVILTLEKAQADPTNQLWPGVWGGIGDLFFGSRGE